MSFKAGRHVHIRADVPVKLVHEALTEAHHFIVRLALRVEVCATLAAAHGQAGQGVLEGLFEGQELQHALGDRGVEADTALIRTDRIVVLHAPAPLNADIAFIVLPADPEADHPIRLSDTPQNLVPVIIFLVLNEVVNIFSDFLNRLRELRLPRIAPLHTLNERHQINVITNRHVVPLGPAEPFPPATCRYDPNYEFDANLSANPCEVSKLALCPFTSRRNLRQLTRWMGKFK